MSKVRVVNFEPTSKGETTHLYTIENNSGASVTLCDLGASVVSIKVPDKNGTMIDVVTGHNNIQEYLTSEEPYFGATCGRYANRIAKGKFTIDGVLYDKLAINNGPNSLHGGVKGFNFHVWDANQLDKQTIEFSRLSLDGEEGFPGNLQVKVIFKLTDDNAVDITYYAETDKPTIVNLTNHSYFNLSGAGDPYIGDHLLCIDADYYLPTDDTAIPYGEKSAVEGTPMDFRKLYEVGSRINEPFEQLVYGKGYDPLAERVFFIELSEIITGKDLDKAVCSRKAGEAPKQTVDFDEMMAKSNSGNLDIDENFYGDQDFDMEDFDPEGFDMGGASSPDPYEQENY